MGTFALRSFDNATHPPNEKADCTASDAHQRKAVWVNKHCRSPSPHRSLVFSP
jgi:hypothetical protein